MPKSLLSHPRSPFRLFATLLVAALLSAFAEPKLVVKTWKWQKHEMPVIAPGLSGAHDRALARAPYVLETRDGTYRMYYTGGSGEGGRLSICLTAASPKDPTQWTAQAAQ